MKKLQIITCLFFLACAAQAQQRYELTVQQAVDLAFKNVVDLKNAQLDYKIQEAKNNEIKGQALPQLSATAGANHYLQLPAILFPDATSTAVYQILKKEGVTGTNGPITTVPVPSLQEVSFQQPWNLTVGATVSQLLFQPDIFVALQARQVALDYNQAAIEQARDKIKDSAYKRYYAILIVQKQLHYLNEGALRLQKLYHDDSIMYKNGFAERLDLDKVQVQLNNLRTTQSMVETGVNLSYAALKFALGISQKDTVVLKDDLTVENLKEDILDDGFKYEDRAEIRELNTSKKLLDLDTKRNKLGYLPTVSLAGNYSINGLGQKFFTDASTIWINSSYIGLNVNIPIFDGFQRRYKVQEAELTFQKMANTIEMAKQGIDFEQVVSKETLRNALVNLDGQQRNQELAEKVYNATKLKFQNGIGSSFEVLQADTDWQQSQANYFNALYNAIIAKISYQYSLGKLK